MTSDHHTSRVAEAARLWSSGLSTADIGEQLGVDERTIRSWLPDRERRRTGPRGRTDVTDDEIVQMRDDDEMSWPQIAEAVGMSRTGVRARYRVATGGQRWR